MHKRRQGLAQIGHQFRQLLWRGAMKMLDASFTTVGSQRHIGIAKQETDVLNPFFMANTWRVEMMTTDRPVCCCWSSFDAHVLVWPGCLSPPAVSLCALAPCGEGDEVEEAGKQAGQQRDVHRRNWFENKMARVSPNVRSCCHALAASRSRQPHTKKFDSYAVGFRANQSGEGKSSQASLCLSVCRSA